MTASGTAQMNVLLDLDGTLTDPREGILNCIRHALNRLNEPCPTDGELERYIGPPLQTSFEVLFGVASPKVTKAIELYRERFSSIGIFENKVYPDIPVALRGLKELGATLFVATSKPTIFAERIIDHFGLAGDIRAVFGSELDGTRSDKTELINYVPARQSLTRDTTDAVGDREHDIRGAKANGVAAIGALWGYGSRKELVDADATVVCERPDQLCDILSSNSTLLTDADRSPPSALAGAAKRES
jgi:phosphoglycolate phosphatase